MRLIRTGTKRTRHAAPCWTEQLAQQLRREYRGLA